MPLFIQQLRLRLGFELIVFYLFLISLLICQILILLSIFNKRLRYKYIRYSLRFQLINQSQNTQDNAQSHVYRQYRIYQTRSCLIVYIRVYLVGLRLILQLTASIQNIRGNIYAYNLDITQDKRIGYQLLNSVIII